MPARLAAMMALFYFSLGAWSVSFPTYQMAAPPRGLAFSTAQVGWIASAFAVGGLVAAVTVGVLADRLFRADRVLAATSLACAGLLTAAAAWCDAQVPVVGAALDAAGGDAEHPAVRAAASAAFRPLLALMLVFQYCVQLGLTLTTVIALRNLPDPARFSRTRMWGTIGWVVAGNAVAATLVAVSTQPLYLGAAAFLALAGFALVLPATPPAAAAPRGVAQALGLPAMRLFAGRSFAVFVAVSFVAVAMNRFYDVYVHKYLTDLGRPAPERDLTLGQVCEVGCLFLVPLLNPRRHLKALMLVGLAGWAVRAAALASGQVPLILAVGVPMHGWSFAFFHVVGTVYLDRQAPPHLRASAQGVLTFAAGGAGALAGNGLAAAVVAANRTGPVTDWPAVWLVPLGGCTAAFVAFLVLFRAPPADKPA